MSSDRHLAICKPLAAGCWANGLLAGSIMTSVVAQWSFCGPRELDRFSCDLARVKKLSCSDTRAMDLVTLVVASVATLLPFLLTEASYACILASVLRAPPAPGSKRPFHLLPPATLFYGTLVVVYRLPDTDTLSAQHKVISVCSAVLTPGQL